MPDLHDLHGLRRDDRVGSVVTCDVTLSCATCIAGWDLYDLYYHTPLAQHVLTENKGPR